MSKSLCKEAFKLILPKGISIHDSQTVYFTEQGCSYRGIFERYIDEEGVSTQQVMETGSTDLIKQYVGLGLGFSMVPAITLNKQDEELMDIEDFYIKNPLYTQLVYHKDKHVFKAMEDFIDLMIEASQSWQ